MTKEKIVKIHQKIQSKNHFYSQKINIDSLNLSTDVIGRSKEAESIIKEIQDKMCPFISVYGKSGVGKSTLVRLVCDSLCESLISTMVNLRKANTIFECTNLIISELGLEQVKSYSGMSGGMNSIQNRIKEICSIQSKERFILILDEFDVIFSDQRHNPSNFIFRLADMISELRTEKIFLSIIAISNNAIFNHQIDERVRSRIESNVIYFAPYTEEEIFFILTEIIEKSAKNKIPHEVILKCAEISHRETGDCRRAIQLLKSAMKITNGNRIMLEHVDEAYDKINSEKINTLLNDLTLHQKCALSVFINMVLFSEKEIQTTAALYEKYCSSCITNKLKPLEYRRFFDILHEIENMGIILGKNHSRGRYGLAREFEMCVNIYKIGQNLDPEWWATQIQLKNSQNAVNEYAKEKIEILKQRKKLARMLSRM